MAGLGHALITRSQEGTAGKHRRWNLTHNVNGYVWRGIVKADTLDIFKHLNVKLEYRKKRQKSHDTQSAEC